MSTRHITKNKSSDSQTDLYIYELHMHADTAEHPNIQI